MKRIIDLGYKIIIDVESLSLYKDGMKVFEYNYLNDYIGEVNSIPISELELIVRAIGELGL